MLFESLTVGWPKLLLVRKNLSLACIVEGLMSAAAAVVVALVVLEKGSIELLFPKPKNLPVDYPSRGERCLDVPREHPL